MKQNSTRSARATRKCPCCRDMPAPTYKLNICAVGERPVEDVLCALSCQPRWHSTQTWVLCQQEYLLSLHEFGSCHRHWGWESEGRSRDSGLVLPSLTLPSLSLHLPNPFEGPPRSPKRRFWRFGLFGRFLVLVWSFCLNQMHREQNLGQNGRFCEPNFWFSRPFGRGKNGKRLRREQCYPVLIINNNRRTPPLTAHFFPFWTRFWIWELFFGGASYVH